MAALKAAEELRAEKAAHCESKEKMAKMAVELKGTADHCQFLEEENRVKVADLEKATMATKDSRSAMRAKKEELRSRGYCGWEALSAAEEVWRSAVCPSGSAVEFDRRIPGLGGERC